MLLLFASIGGLALLVAVAVVVAAYVTPVTPSAGAVVNHRARRVSKASIRDCGV